MLRVRLLLVVGTVLALAGAVMPEGSAQAQGPPPRADFGLSHHAVCGSVAAGKARCFADVVEHRGRLGTEATTAPTGLSPATLQSAYGFTTSPTAGAGRTIAIVDANDDPTAESDLGAFANQYGLPACTTANGCFTKVDENGGTSYPAADPSWALEISLDVQWAHAVAPGAKILLVEASSASFSDLLTAEQYATAHAQYVTNSWGGQESFLDTLFDSDFSAPGVSVFASSGDSGLPASYPSSSPNVISVGGTTLNFDANNNFTGEAGWSSGGGGCSAYESATTAQANFSQYSQVGCNGSRATPDVAMDADPASGVSVYDSTPYSGQTGWYKVGGTSVSSPVFAARSAIQGVTVDANYVYGSNIPFRDITSGNNGAPCLVGYDLCSGRGSWADSGTPPPPPPTAPSAPTLTATGGNAVVHLTWNTPSNGGSPITNFKVYRGTSPGAETLLTTLGTVTSYDDTTVTNGTPYYYKVSAVNSVSEGPTSTEASATPVAAASIVTHITSLNGHGSVGLFTWTSWADVNVADQNGHPVSGVTVTFAVSGGATTTRSCTTNSSGYCSTKNSKVSVSVNKPSVTYVTSNLAKNGTTWDGVRWGVTLTLP
jgi:hypothetical protein